MVHNGSFHARHPHGHGGHQRAPVFLLPYCTDGQAAHVTLEGVCKSIQGQAGVFCHTLHEMQLASCEELASETFMRGMVEKAGLTPDTRGAQIYGNSSTYQVQVHGKSARHKVGLWQSPAQIAAALIHVGSRIEVRRYIEVGVFTAWTCCFVSTYLRRVGGVGTFKGYAVDLVNTAIAAGTKSLLPRLNVTFAYRKNLDLTHEAAYDFCFIDGDHVRAMPRGGISSPSTLAKQLPSSACPCVCVVCAQAYTGVRRDYASFSPTCRYMMFHDIQDVSTLHLGNFSGGVPMFWAHLAAHTRRHRHAEFTHEPPNARLPSFGLGVLGPNRDGTCEPDIPGLQTAWHGGDLSVETAWRELCRLNRTRLCNLGVETIGDANSVYNAKHAKSVNVNRGRLRLYTKPDE